MSFFVNRLFGLIPSQESVGWVTSVVVHAMGALVASATFVSFSGELPKLVGSRGATEIELQATWIEAEPPQEAVEIVASEPQVVVMPDRVRVAQQTFFPVGADVSQPTPTELAMVDRMMASAAAVRRRTASDLPPGDLDISQRHPGQPRSGAPLRHTRATRPAAELSAARAQVFTSVQKQATVGSDEQTPPRLLSNRPPTYPARAVGERLEGTVMLRVSITAEGSVGALEVFATSGHPILDAAAARAVRGWRFVPANRNGRSVSTTVRLPVRFALDAQ